MNEQQAVERVEAYMRDKAKLTRAIAGTNRAKKSPAARRLLAGKSPSPDYVKSRFFGRLGTKSAEFKELICVKLDYCGNDFQLARDAIKAVVRYLLALAQPALVLLAELAFLLQHRKFNSYCDCL